MNLDSIVSTFFKTPPGPTAAIGGTDPFFPPDAAAPDFQQAAEKTTIAGVLAQHLEDRQKNEITKMLTSAQVSAADVLAGARAPTSSDAAVIPEYADVLANASNTLSGGASARDAGAGRGFVNPPNVVPRTPELDAALESLGMGVFNQAGARPMTGEANTDGGIERVNSDSGFTGARAVRQKDGTVLLTNLAADGSRMEKTQDIQGRPLAPAVTRADITAPVVLPNSINAALTQLQNAKTPEEAEGIQLSLRQSLADQEAKITKQAMDFAANKVGVPGMEQKLLQSEAADRASSGWYPGLGDSAITNRLRETTTNLRAAADTEAKRFLATNSSLASLKATADNANTILKRLNGGFDRDDRLAATTAEQAQRRNMLASEQVSSWDSVIKDRILSIVPMVDSQGRRTIPTDIQLYQARQRIESTADGKAALAASAPVLPILAVKGNGTARNLLSAQERRDNPAATEDSVNATFAQIHAMAIAGDFPEKFQAAFGGADVNKKKSAAEAMKAKLAAAASPQEKAAVFDERYAQAWSLFKAQQTAKFAGNVGAWNIPELQPYVAAAHKVANSTSLDNVTTAYIGESTGPEALKKAMQLQSIVETAASQNRSSVFGAPDIMKLKSIVAEKARANGAFTNFNIGRRLVQGVRGAVGGTAIMGATSELAQSNFGIYDGIADLFGPAALDSSALDANGGQLPSQR